MDFFIGDRVRLLYSRAEGVIVKLLPDGLVEVDIDDDFVVPVHISELVPIGISNKALGATAPSAATRTVHSTPQVAAAAPPPSAARSVQGLYLAAIAFGNQEIEFCLVNNTDIDFLYAFFSRSAKDTQKGVLKGVKAGLLPPKSVHKLQQERLQTIAEWHSYLFEITPFAEGYNQKQPSFQSRFTFKKEDFAAKPTQMSLLNTPAVLFQLDESEKINAEQLRTSMLTPKTAAAPSAPTPKPENTVIDLHIEKLLPDTFGDVNKAEMLQIQLAHFDKMLDQAMLHKQASITFIHGLGNGILKEEIQKLVSKNPNIDTFKDAQKQKFGYGAIEIFFK